MAREYARIMTAIWSDRDFRALDEAEQRLFLLLCTQPDISAAGVLALRVRRWAALACDSTADRIARLLRGLEAARFVVTDWDTEELLVRSFIRWDAGFNNPKRRPVIVRAGREVISGVIVGRLAEEFKRVGLPDLDSPPDPPPGRASGRASDGLSDGLSDTQTEIDFAESRSGPLSQVNGLSDRASPSEGVVGTYVSSSLPLTTNPENGYAVFGTRAQDVDLPQDHDEDPVPAPVPLAPASRGTRLPADFAVTAEMREWVRDECPGVDGRRETEAFIDYWRGVPGARGRKVDWPATWRNWMRKASPATSRPGTAPRRRTTDDKRAALREIAARKFGSDPHQAALPKGS